jgi:hypothetical protein
MEKQGARLVYIPQSQLFFLVKGGCSTDTPNCRRARFRSAARALPQRGKRLGSVCARFVWKSARAARARDLFLKRHMHVADTACALANNPARLGLRVCALCVEERARYPSARFVLKRHMPVAGTACALANKTARLGSVLSALH